MSYEMIPEKILLTDGNQRETHMVPKGGIRVLEKTRGAGKIEGRR